MQPRASAEGLRLRWLLPIFQVMGAPLKPRHAAWLFTRDGESVCLELAEDASGYRLSVRGPGRLRAIHEFDALDAALSAARQYRATFLRDGFVLHRDGDRREPRTLRRVRAAGSGARHANARR